MRGILLLLPGFLSAKVDKDYLCNEKPKSLLGCKATESADTRDIIHVCED